MREKNLLKKALFVKKGLTLKARDIKQVIPLKDRRKLIFFVYTCYNEKTICLGFLSEKRKIRKTKKTEVFLKKVYEREEKEIPTEFSASMIEGLETI